MATMRTKKILRIILAVFVVIFIALLIGSYIFYRDLTKGPLPQHDGELTVAGLYDTVEILRDEWGIPHIYASSLHDLFFAQGYTQAQDRWWQMEFWRHVGSGRIEETTGKDEDLLAADIMIRTLGWRQIAQQEIDLLDDETMAHLQAFTDGVNAYILERGSRDLALEYGVLSLVGKGIELEPWTPADSVVWAKVMAWDLGPSSSAEEARSILYESLGQEMTDQWLTPPWPYGERPTILQSEDLDIAAATDSPELSVEATLIEEPDIAGGTGWQNRSLISGSGKAVGSNNWVVNGNMTKTGMPLLANDPHLGIQMPSIWYEIGLHLQPEDGQESYDVVGFAFSAIPGIVIGHNSFIAWGVTNTGPDVFDLYRIRINPDNPLQYEWNDEWRDMTVRSETISFAGSKEPVTIQVRETHLGPIINDNELDDETGEVLGFNNEDPLALRWTALEPGTITRAVFLLNRATNWEEFRTALQYWDVPSQNFVYADTEGNVGYQMPGRIPIRARNHSGLLPVPGWTDEFEWQGFIPFESLPSVFNPQQGYVATANQAVVPPAYYEKLAQDLGEGQNYVFSQEWDYGYRAQRINDLLEQSAPHSIASFKRIQGDNRLISVLEVIPYLGTLQIDDTELDEARDWLLEWNHRFDADSPQAALYAQFWASLMDILFNDQIDDERLDDIVQAHGIDSDMRATSLLLQDPDNPWWDDASTDDEIETRDDTLLRSFREGYTNTVDELGKDRNKWKWGDLHTATFESNPLGASGVGLIERVVNRGPFSVGGSTATVNNTAWSVESDEIFSVRWLPSMRMIIDMGDFTQSVTVNTTGQSGHPYSSHYADMIDNWRTIEYHPMLWTREQVETAAVARLVLNPEL